MIAVQFGQSSGWFHPAASGDQVVVLCPPIGFEALALYRPLRIFADRLVAAGYGVLRFDYPGTGDAPGHESQPNRLDDWVDSVVAAIGWAAGEVGAADTVLCGVQFGGLLASLAAARFGPARRMVLMAPVVSGRTYIRAQRAMASLSDGVTTSGDAEFLDAPAQRLHRTTVEAIGAVNLATMATRPADSLLLLEPPGLARKAFADRLGALGCAVTAGVFTGYDAAVRDAHLNDVPIEAFDSVVEWLRLVPTGPRTLHLPASAPTMAVEGATETRMVFPGGGHTMAGVLTLPPGPVRGGLLVANTGANPHFGYGRFAVSLARRLAPHGIATLRMDLAGAGDTVAGQGDGRPHLVDGDRSGEIAAATDLLAGTGAAPLAFTGICSGAFHALTAGLHDPRIRLVLPINLEVFTWGRAERLIELRHRLRGARPAAGGADHGAERLAQTDLGYRRGVGRRVRRWVVAASAAAQRLAGRSAAWRIVRTLSARGQRVQFVVGDGDLGLHLLQTNFGPGAARLREFPGIGMTVLDGLDHTLGSHHSRELALPVLERLLLRMVGASSREVKNGALPQPPPKDSHPLETLN